MLWTIFLILLVLWILGFTYGVAGGFIHVLLAAAVIVLIINLVMGRRTVV
ncbi:MAG TPA: lmo0937 family membrane protein [Terriglobales bacterium]|nr:lmo0937 family membrane protein [Terriglobales bacterium]